MGKEIVMTRRELLAAAIAATVIASLPKGLRAATAESGMPYRILGRTGEKISIIGLGGYHIGIQPDEKESIEIIRTAIDNGVNFLDNSWDYNDGASESRMGKALRDGYRQKVFLMTKIDGRDRKTAARQIDQSLQRLRTDRIDLMQFHEINSMHAPARIFGPNGAIEAVAAAQKAGKIRYIGFTGHKSPAIHLKMLETALSHQYILDAVQMPLNVMDAHYDSFEKKVLPALLKHKIGVLGMKPMGGGLILKSSEATPVECLQYAMSLPASVVITGCESLAILKQALNTAHGFRQMSEERISSLLIKTANTARTGQYERYKTSHDFDDSNPAWFGGIDWA